MTTLTARTTRYFLLTLGLGLAANSVAEAKSVKIEVLVLTGLASKTPLPGALVQIRKGRDLVHEGTTGPDGTYSGRVPEGRYHLGISKEGLDPFEDSFRFERKYNYQRSIFLVPLEYRNLVERTCPVFRDPKEYVDSSGAVLRPRVEQGIAALEGAGVRANMRRKYHDYIRSVDTSFMGTEKEVQVWDCLFLLYHYRAISDVQQQKLRDALEASLVARSLTPQDLQFRRMPNFDLLLRAKLSNYSLLAAVQLDLGQCSEADSTATAAIKWIEAIRAKYSYQGSVSLSDHEDKFHSLRDRIQKSCESG